ncbi:class I SAM-dependent methyltransferase [Flagellimonas sp. 2504JD4-2]
MCKPKSDNGNPIRGKFNSWLFGVLDGYFHYMYKKKKERLFGSISGTLVEIGSGAGANFKYLKDVDQVIAVEPNPYMHASLQESADKRNIKLQINPCSAEEITIESNSVDTVISTLTLCTIKNEKRALDEIKRILKPNGKFIFIEHVSAKKGSLVKFIQWLIRKPWFWLFEGCHTHKDIASSIQNAGFSKVNITRFKFISPFIPIIPQISGYTIK